MGNPFSRGETSSQESSRKRCRSDLNEPETAPVIKRMGNTSLYIFQTLFVEGQGSDITIKIPSLDYEWKLHKVYLKQSGYFRSLFSGNWDVDQHVHTIGHIEDVTVQAMTVAFGAMYTTEVAINQAEVTNVYAAACFLQLEDLMYLCHTIMKDSIFPDTVIKYYDTAEKYSLPYLKNLCFTWLVHNLMYSFVGSNLIRTLSAELLSNIVLEPNFIVVHLESSLYYFLRQWLYLQLVEAPEPNGAATFFANRRSPQAFLESEQATGYIKTIFSAIHLENFILDPRDALTVYADRIFPERVLHQATKNVVLNTLRMDLHMNLELNEVPIELFHHMCLRYSRKLFHKVTVWRWCGFKYGLDFNLSFDGTVLKLMWATSANAFEYNASTLRIIYRLQLIDDNEEVLPCSKELTDVVIERDNELILAVLNADKAVKFPVKLLFQVVLVPFVPASVIFFD